MNNTHSEQQLIQTIDRLKAEWIELHHAPQREWLTTLSKQWDKDWNQLQAEQRERKLNRNIIRSTLLIQDEAQHNQLIYQSQNDSLERRQFKIRQHEALTDLNQIVASYDERIQVIQQTRKLLSRQLSGLLQQISLTPLSHPFTVLYEDTQLLAIDKPAGLLSVPGRTSDRQDSVQRYLQQANYPHTDDQNQSGKHQSSQFKITAIHRLDQDTSGVLLLAKDPVTLKTLQQQFEHRQVQKTYEAILETNSNTNVNINQTYSSGIIDLPLWGDPENRPYQEVNYTYGKQALTQFQPLSNGDRIPSLPGIRVQFTPLTGRSHQLRVHAASQSGLNNPILGDRLYGTQSENQCYDRLYLHATSCVITHQGKLLKIVSPAPF